MTPVYLDNNSTTPVDPAVLAAMLPYLQGEFGNPSSAHALGHRARDAVKAARAQVAALIGARPDEILFTSGGTEASNIAIRGAARCDPARGAIVTSEIEHPATETCCAHLQQNKHPVTRVSAGRDGLIDAEEIARAVTHHTALVTLIHAQNEIGTLQPIAEVKARCERYRPLIHADAAQSVGKIPVNVTELGVDLLSIAGHKLYAPKGVGALYIRRGVALPPMLLGAGQESGRRPGTENVAFIVGIGAACRLASISLGDKSDRRASLSGVLLGRLESAIPGLMLVGHPVKRLPNTLNVLFPGISGRQLLEACPGVLASNGSACHAGSEKPSPVLLALGISPEAALGAVRLSLGRNTTAAEVETAASRLIAAWQLLTKTTAVRAAS